MLDTLNLQTFGSDQSYCANKLLGVLSSGISLNPMDGLHIGAFESRALEPQTEGLCLALDGDFGRVAITVPVYVLEHLLDALLQGWRNETPDALPLEWQVIYVWDSLFQGTFLGGAEISVLASPVKDPGVPILTGTVEVMGQRVLVDFAVLEANASDRIWTFGGSTALNSQMPCRLTLSTDTRAVSSAFVEGLERGDIVFLQSAGEEDGLSVKLNVSSAFGWNGTFNVYSDQLHLTKLLGG